MRALNRVAAGLLVAGVCGKAAWAQGGEVIALHVDLRDAPQKLIHATETIPVQPGALTLAYPEWIPGLHGPTGPIKNQAGLLITGDGGQIVRWERDPVMMYSYHLTVPSGVSRLTVKMDFITAASGGEFAAGGSTSASLALLNWNTVVMYPFTGPEMKVSNVMVRPSITLPVGWKFGTALEADGGAGGGGPAQQPGLSAGMGSAQAGQDTSFKAVSLEQLIDSPLMTGRFFREIALAPEVLPKHFLDMAGDGPEDLEISPAHVEEFNRLVRETGALYRSRHYGAYHFLVTLSDETSHYGLEHHQSSDDRVATNTFTNDTAFTLDGFLLPHEFTHSWNGKYRRPVGLATPNYQVPMIGDLLWVYEGLTAYLSDVLTVHSGIWTAEQYRDRLAEVAAQYNHRPGRTWRDIADTARMAQVLYDAVGPYENWRLRTDFYDEGELLWMDVDMTIRAKTDGRKSLNDFVAAFMGLGGNTAPKVVPYTFDDVVAGLNGVVANDWAGFLTERLTSLQKEPSMGGITEGGYRLVYRDRMNEWTALNAKVSGVVDFWYSLGLHVRADGRVGDVEIGGLAEKAGFGPGMRIIAVNGRAFTVPVLRAAVQAAKGGTEPIEINTENTGFYRVLKVDWHGGEQFPALERVAGTPDRMDDLLKPMLK